jgi:hypothetical protein
MRDIRRAFQRKPFHLWIPGRAVARDKRRGVFSGGGKAITKLNRCQHKVVGSADV